jgi:hypothetical protein
MIRDPSDGSVKEKPALPMTSALPSPKINAEELARLERSREWIRRRRDAFVNNVDKPVEELGESSQITESFCS